MDLIAYERNVRARTVVNVLEQAAAAYGDRPFLRDSGSADWISFTAAFQRAQDFAGGFLSHGVTPGSLVPFMLPNSVDYALAWFGLNLAGSAYLSINTSLVGDLLAAQFALSRSPVWVVHADYLPLLDAFPDALRSRAETLVVMGTVPDGVAGRWKRVIALADLTQGKGTQLPPAATFTDLAAISFTSGTTGPSKGVMITHGQAVSSALTFASLLDLKPDDVIYTPLPMFHGMSTRMGVLPALMTGCRIVLGKRFSGSRFWLEAIEAEATLAQIIFSIPAVLLGQPPGPQDRSHRVTRMFNAHTTAGFEERFGARLIEAFGISEVGLFLGSPGGDQKPGSAGRALPDWDVDVVDADGVSVPEGSAGEIVCRPRLPGIMMRGYLNQPDRTAEATRDLWYHTGDIARRDAEGYYWFLDRAKERIRRRGENISSMEIEICVRSHPDISDVAALAHPAREGEDDIRLMVVPQPGKPLSAPTLHNWLQGKLPRFMLPRYVEVVASLPYTATNKIEKSRLMAAGLGPDAWDSEAAGAVNRSAANVA